MATGNNQEEMVRIMKEGMDKTKEIVGSEEKMIPFVQEYPNGLGTFDLILKELRRANSLLSQLRNIALGLPVSPSEIEETNG